MLVFRSPGGSEVWLAGGAQVLAQGHGNGLAKSTYAVSSDNLARESLHWLIKVFT